MPQNEGSAIQFTDESTSYPDTIVGWSWDFGQVVIAYAVIQALDGNVLVPLLFSEVVNLHPVVIILAILLFGGLWGFWGIFFAIPLATLFKAVLNAWPRKPRDETAAASEEAPAEEDC